MARENLTWRSFANGRAINARWNAFASAFYAIDHKGVIRYKWLTGPGEKAIDGAVGELIKEAEAER